MSDKEKIKASAWLLLIAMLIATHATMYVIGKRHMHEEIADLEMKEGRILPAKIFNMTRKENN